MTLSNAGSLRRPSAYGREWLLAFALIVAATPAMAQDGAGEFELAPQDRPDPVQPDREERREPPPPAGPVLEIPSMIERPLDPDEGERVEVRRFELTGVRDIAAKDIAVEDIRAIVEEARQERSEGFTVGQLQQVADRITNYYRERGLILSRAIVPVQTVEEGVVELEVIEGRLGRVRPQDNDYYSDATIRSAFTGLTGEPVTQQDTEAALLTLTDYPGLAAFGVFEPGDSVGEADLIVRTQDEQALEGDLGVDNHGTESTGQGRARATLHWNNVTDHADRLTLRTLASFDPANTTYGALEYQRYFGRHYQAGGFLRSNRFDVGGELEDFDISGETDQAGIHGTRVWVRSRDLNVSSELGLTLKRSRTFLADQQNDEDRLTVLHLQTRFDSVDARFGGLNFGGLEINRGFNDALGAMGDADSAAEQPLEERPSRRGAEGYAEGEFSSVFGYYSRLQNLAPGHSLLVRGELQHSDDVLVSMEQYAIGGASNVRAFPSSHALVDKAWLLSAEYVVEASWLEGSTFFGHSWADILSATVFYDHASGQLNEPRANEPEDSVTFAGAGAGLRLRLPGTFEARLQAAWETESNDEIADPEAVDDPQLWAELRYSF